MCPQTYNCRRGKASKPTKTLESLYIPPQWVWSKATLRNMTQLHINGNVSWSSLLKLQPEIQSDLYAMPIAFIGLARTLQGDLDACIVYEAQVIPLYQCLDDCRWIESRRIPNTATPVSTNKLMKASVPLAHLIRRSGNLPVGRRAVRSLLFPSQGTWSHEKGWRCSSDLLPTWNCVKRIIGAVNLLNWLAPRQPRRPVPRLDVGRLLDEQDLAGTAAALGLLAY